MIALGDASDEGRRSSLEQFLFTAADSPESELPPSQSAAKSEALKPLPPLFDQNVLAPKLPPPPPGGVQVGTAIPEEMAGR